MIRTIDRFWERASNDAGFIAALFMVAGVMLVCISYLLGLHSVYWNGKVAGALVEGMRVADKQVGYAWAPNWGLAGVLVLPLAIYHLLGARAAIEPTIVTLVQRGMIVTTEFGEVEKDRLIAAWKRESRRWSAVAAVVFVFIVGFVFFGDYCAVVLKWFIASLDEVRAIIDAPEHPIRLNHSEYEFDWSVAALFENSPTSRGATAAFGLAAYIVVAMLGPGILLAGFIWFLSLCSFFSQRNMRNLGFIMVPDLNSRDKRAGYEAFEPMFTSLVLAAIFTAALALSMHLQNVFLRSPTEENIVKMVFGGSFAAISQAMKDWNPGQIIKFLKGMDAVIATDVRGLSLQTYAAGVAFALLSAIIFGSVWFWLRKMAREGIAQLRSKPGLTPSKRTKLDQVVIWPLGWISLNVLLAVGLLILLSMWFINFVALVLVFFLARSISLVIAQIVSSWKKPPGSHASRS